MADIEWRRNGDNLICSPDRNIRLVIQRNSAGWWWHSIIHTVAGLFYTDKIGPFGTDQQAINDCIDDWNKTTNSDLRSVIAR